MWGWEALDFERGEEVVFGQASVDGKAIVWLEMDEEQNATRE